MNIAVPKEILSGEKRVALVPETAQKLIKAGFTVAVETGAGLSSGFSDAEYEAKGATVVADARKLLASGEIVLKVRPPEDAEIACLSEGATLVAMLAPHQNAPLFEKLAARRVSAYAMELMPRISRAQSMDVLSSQSSLAGYRCVLEAAIRLPKIFPMMMTAAGTLPPAHVFILGAGVAGLQAIATARRLGAMVEAYDVRPAVKDEVKSLGAKFLEIPLETADAATSGGYAKAQGEEFLERQRALMLKHLASSDVVITTALIPGKKAPVLVTSEMVKAMRPGSVLIDLAAEQGGNCPLSKPGEDVIVGGVTIVGMKDVASLVAMHASMAYARNLLAFLLAFTKDGRLTMDREDALVKATLVTGDGQVIFR